MDMLPHVSINIFPIVMLLIIYWNNRERKVKTKDQYQFDVLTRLTIGLMLADIFSNGVNDISQRGSDKLLWGMYVIHLLLLVAVACVWLMYVGNRLHADSCVKHYKAMQRGAWSIGAIFAVLALTTPWTHLLFTITEERGYQRNSFYFLTYLVSIGILMVSVMISAYVYKKKPPKNCAWKAYIC